MNILLVLIDSLNRHQLAAYGATAAATPNLSAFARKAWRMDNHFVGSLPCMPARREIFSGTQEFMKRPWGPLEPFDQRLPRLVEQQGYTTAIVTDHYHYWEEAANGYVQSFSSTEFIRGHELDYWQPLPADDDALPDWVENIERWRPGQGRRYYANVKQFRGEEDFFPAKVMSGAASWLRKHATARRPFFLQVESFDVHEPFHTPEPYASLYGNGNERDIFTLWPPYQDSNQLARFMQATSREELGFIRAQYLGKLTMVDTWFGKLLQTLDQLDLWKDTMIIVTTDHGHDLGERGAFGKQYPHFDSHANIPLLVWHPQYPGNGRSLSALTTTIDLFATVLDAVGITVAPDSTISRSMLPLLAGTTNSLHEALLYGTFGQGVCCTDGEWTLFKSPEQDGPLYYYSSMIMPGTTSSRLSNIEYGHYLPNVDVPLWRVPKKIEPLSRENFLFQRRKDPHQEQNLWLKDLGQQKRMLDLLHTLLEQATTPAEQYTRLGLVR
ncbi:sulfatase [Dictyobacter sp. S3.2.2.5]|uniref:Sulfatase n=1 Tax=Dictyobacter halimunensis TaxID=3026934 RepID=A0ABQ6FJ90_9CHLR|nr:sulfatase [Dictyobacter sp. S3.2.2.5]